MGVCFEVGPRNGGFPFGVSLKPLVKLCSAKQEVTLNRLN